MQQAIQNQARNRACTNHLRVVFAEIVLRLDLCRDATLVDVARTLSPVLRQRYGEPLDIRVVLDLPAASRHSPATSRPAEARIAVTRSA